MQHMLLGLGADASLKHTVSDNDTNLNASTIFGSDYTVDIAKIIIIPSGFEIGATTSTSNRALTIPSGLVGTLEIQNAGTISGAGGAGGSASGGSAGGSAIYIASNNVTVTNTGTIRGGGGGGRGGSNGQSYMNRFVYGASGNTVDCLGGTGGAGGNGEGYNSAATNGVGGTSRYTSWTQYGGYFASLGYGACNTSGSWTNGGSGGNGGNFGAQGGNNGGAGGKYIELASSISYTLSNSGTLTGNAP